MITAKQISDWAASGEAQRALPRLVRRLIHSTATTTHMTMPAGDSVSSPGLDGELFSENGNTWVPKGHSCWEASCRSDVTAKANEDYKKRSDGDGTDGIGTRVYVAVTGRKWAGKAKWREQKIREGRWSDVRAYDADDLEQWLEQSPAVALAFGEELGIAGAGLVSLQSYFSSWARQSSPVITSKALLAGRDRQRERIIDKTRDALGKLANPVTVRGDSVEEAVAFIAAALTEQPDLALRAVVVTETSGWRFVEKNIEISIAVAARPELAEAPPVREGLVLLIPYASGDMARQFKGVAGRLDDPERDLDRPDHSEFENALRDIGLDENDSRRLAEQCGRSWSVFRRQHAVNPAIRRPAWLDHASVPALATLCLIGTWSSDKLADKDAVARVAGRPYDQLERDLLQLEKLDDSPVLHIGTVWKAKSALELLSLYGDQITEAEIERFFVEISSQLSSPDPQLELPNSERYAAAIHGKTRPISQYLMDAFCDTLIKLGVRGADIPNLAANHIEIRVDRVVRELLHDADETRWLSLASELPALAEASPDAFLSAVEASLAKAPAPVRRLITETDSPGGVMGGRCWHAGLLWALETLAWAPQRLVRVSLILATLAETEIKGNWGNSPKSSLLDLYRSWFPQTGATVEQRIAALDILIARKPNVALQLLDSLTGSGPDSASHIARPKWRDDDAGAGYGATGLECQTMLKAAADRHLKLARQKADEIAKLVEKYSSFDDTRRSAIIDLLHEMNERSDEDKEIVRGALRSKIHWHLNYGDSDQADNFIPSLQAAYDRLTPRDKVIADAWLFRSNWLDLPRKEAGESYEDRNERVLCLRKKSLKSLFAEEGWPGVIRLTEYTRAGWAVGFTLANIDAESALIAQLVKACGDLQPGRDLTELAGGMVAALLRNSGYSLLDKIFSQADMHGHSLDWKIRLLVMLPEEQACWDKAQALGPEAEALYWKTCRGMWQSDKEALLFAAQKLVDAGRPITALCACHINFAGIPAELVFQMLQGLLVADGREEPDAKVPEYYYIQAAIDYVEASGEIDRMRLAQLEFPLIKALGFEGEQHAASLYHVLMSQPEVFVELLCILYKPRNGANREADEGTAAAASNVWSILHACKRQPGTLDDNSITFESSSAYVHRVRELALEQDRLEVCDVHLGEILARSDIGDDGIFPSVVAREILESINSDDMLQGFGTGCFNKRGVFSRGLFDGGEQERDLAANYRRSARALEITHPRVSSALENLAKSYDRDGMREDTEARLRREAR